MRTDSPINAADFEFHAPLILGTLAGCRPASTGRREALPLFRELPARTVPKAELDAVREALADPRSTHERVLDGVVDRLLKELTW